MSELSYLSSISAIGIQFKTSLLQDIFDNETSKVGKRNTVGDVCAVMFPLCDCD